MSSQAFLSYQAQKFFDRLVLVLFVVFAGVALSNWSRLAQWVAPLFSDHQNEPIVRAKLVVVCAVAVLVVVAWSAWSVAAVAALTYDWAAKRRKFDPDRQGGRGGAHAPPSHEIGASGLVRPEELGPVLHSHFVAKPIRAWMARAFGMVLILPAIPLAFAAGGDFPLNVAGPLASALLLYCVVQLFRAKPTDKTLRVRRDGVECICGRETRAYRWREIEAVREGSTTHDQPRGRSYVVHDCGIRTYGLWAFGVANVHPKTEATFAAIVETLHARTSELLLPLCRQRLHARQRVDFGPVVLDGEWLHFGVRSMRCSEIAAVKVERWVVAIYRRGEAGVPFASFPYGKLWNPRVLLVLLNEWCCDH